MTITQPFLIPAEEQRREPWRVLAGGERTGGLVAIGDAHMPPRTRLAESLGKAMAKVIS